MPILSFFRRRRALRDLSGATAHVRSKAVDALAALGSDDDRRAIEAVLLDHTYPSVQLAAANALGRLAHPDSPPTLKQVLAPGFFPVNLGTGIDLGHADARDRARLRAACEKAISQLRHS